MWTSLLQSAMAPPSAGLPLPMSFGRVPVTARPAAEIAANKVWFPVKLRMNIVGKSLPDQGVELACAAIKAEKSSASYGYTGQDRYVAYHTSLSDCAAGWGMSFTGGLSFFS